MGWLRRRPELFEWYGIADPFRVRRLPVWWKCTPETRDRANLPEFNAAALRYVRWTRPGLVMTRSYRIARDCLDRDFPVLFETHAPPDPHPLQYLRDFGPRPNLVGVVTTTPLLRDAYAEAGVPGERILVWPNGIDLGRVRQAPADRNAARKRLQLPRDARIALYTGSLWEHKGVATILEAAPLLPEVRFLLVGGSPSEISEWAEDYGDLANVAFPGFVPSRDLWLYLAAADVCLVPNTQEDRTVQYTWPLKVLDAMAARRPIVASDLPALGAILEHGHSALLVPPDQPRALADAIRALLEAPERAAQLVEVAWKKVQRYTWDARARAVLERFAPDLVGSPGGSAPAPSR
jgi:glycosyltransferase involved in cell wall biosynthesis